MIIITKNQQTRKILGLLTFNTTIIEQSTPDANSEAYNKKTLILISHVIKKANQIQKVRAATSQRRTDERQRFSGAAQKDGCEGVD